MKVANKKRKGLFFEISKFKELTDKLLSVYQKKINFFFVNDENISDEEKKFKKKR